MSQPDPSARPSQVTVAGWAVAIASVMLLVAVFDTMGRLDSVDMRERLATAVSSGSMKGFGLTVGDAIEVLRWCLYVSGVAAAASGILGVFVLQGHRGARIGLTVAAASIVLTATLVGSFSGFLGMLIGIGTALLWTQPARDWFAGRPITPRVAPPRPENDPPSEPRQPLAWAPPTPGSSQPPPTAGWGQVPGPATSPVASAWPAPTTAPVAAVGPDTATRPSQVRLACILTWVLSSITGLGSLVVLAGLAVDSHEVLARFRDTPAWEKSFDDDTAITVLTVLAATFSVWSLAAVVLATFAWRRVRWAWVLLVVSAWLAALVSVLVISLPHIVVIGIALGMLMRRPTRAWFTREPYLAPPRSNRPKPPVW